MKVVAVLLAVFAASSAAPALLYPAGTAPLVHAPRYDSAIIRSDRLGGNFAYSTLEAHAYSSVSPIVQNVISPVGVSYTATPIQYPAFAAYPGYAPAPAFVASAPVASYAPIAPIAPIYPGVAPVVAPAAPAAPEAPVPAPIADEIPAADNVESSASSDDSITVEAA
ncbi:nematocyst expressed protein 3-like [Macrosteles quadrilineatus]|uniref:nematocyst expressed protein 3-like n=1 Tax=Macrosteles quadrilineatus TaxID=74068 RepID=UPI0023E1B838|nr:nematocyst expressed protein 3-like [Macrosteles quadrilineatus]